MLINIKCLIEVCEELKIKYGLLDKNGNFIKVHIDEGFYFSNCTTPFNSEVIGQITKDKEFAYNSLKNVINTPKTVGFLDPFCDEKYRKYLRKFTYEEISEFIVNKFQMPVIVKSNFGTQGTNVFKCSNLNEISSCVNQIFNKESKDYSYICLAQKYIPPVREYRVIVFNHKISFIYLKDISSAKFIGNLSPLHWENAKAILIENKKLSDQLYRFIFPLFSTLTLEYGGLDIIEDKTGNYWLIEINTKPGFDFFLQDNGGLKLKELYKNMLNYLNTKY